MNNPTPIMPETNNRFSRLLKSITDLPEKEQRILLKFIDDNGIKKRKHYRKTYFMEK